MNSDAIFSSIGASRIKTFIKINGRQQIMVFYKQLSVRTHQMDTCESAFIALRNLKLPKSYVNVQKHIRVEKVKDTYQAEVSSQEDERLYWRACPDESVFTDSVCRMSMRDLGIGLR